MTAWWDSLDIVVKVLYCIAVPASVVMIIQTVLSFVGGFGGGEGVNFSDTSGLSAGDIFDGGSSLGELADGDIGGSGLSLDGGNPADFSIAGMLTVQGIITFLTVMSWTSLVAIYGGMSTFLAILTGSALGVLAMYLVARLLFASRRLTENGTLNLRNAIGENAKVYVPVPPHGEGEGKVTLHVQGRYTDCACISFADEQIATGTAVRITDLRNGVLVVEREEN